MKTKKRFLSILLSLALMLSLVPAFSMTALAVEHNHTGWTEWTNTTSLPDSSGSYYLSQNVTISGSWSVPSGKTNLCLNGHSITRLGGDGNQVIEVGNGTFNLYDETGDNGIISHGSGVNGAGVWVGGSGAFNMHGGKITGNSASNGAGVYSEGNFTMSGGSITNNTASSQYSSCYILKSRKNFTAKRVFIFHQSLLPQFPPRQV